jgi:hypothetical protein
LLSNSTQSVLKGSVHYNMGCSYKFENVAFLVLRM